jgi:uncharacterized protein YndB with AHSA1/START domain
MKDHIERQFEMNAPVEVVFNIVTDAINITLFSGAGKIPGAVKRAADHRFVGQVENILSADGSILEEEVLEFDPPKRMKLHFRKFGIPGSIFIEQVFDAFDFESLGEKTRIYRSIKIHFRKNVIAEMLGRRLLMGKLNKSVDLHHQRIRERLEVGLGKGTIFPFEMRCDA